MECYCCLECQYWKPNQNGANMFPLFLQLIAGKVYLSLIRICHLICLRNNLMTSTLSIWMTRCQRVTFGFREIMYMIPMIHGNSGLFLMVFFKPEYFGGSGVVLFLFVHFLLFICFLFAPFEICSLFSVGFSEDSLCYILKLGALFAYGLCGLLINLLYIRCLFILA